MALGLNHYSQSLLFLLKLGVILLRLFITFAFSLLLCLPVWAGDKLYVHDSSRIMLVDVDAKTLTLVARPTLDGTMTDIATDSAGTLYVLTFTSLYRLNGTDGTANLIGAHGVVGANALSFDGSGVLYAASNSDTLLYRLNLSTGRASVAGNVPTSSAGDLAFIKGRLFFAGNNDTLGVINLSNTQQPSTVGSFGLATSVFGLAPGDSGTLYGAAYSKLFKVEPSTGAVSYVMDFGNGLGQAFGMAPLKATPTRDEDRLFNYAEDKFPGLFVPVFSPSLQSGTYYYRFYRESGAILAVTQGQLVYYVVGGTPIVLGPVSDFLASVTAAGY